MRNGIKRRDCTVPLQLPSLQDQGLLVADFRISDNLTYGWRTSSAASYLIKTSLDLQAKTARMIKQACL